MRQNNTMNWEEALTKHKKHSELKGAKRYDGYSTGKAWEGNQRPFASSHTVHKQARSPCQFKPRFHDRKWDFALIPHGCFYSFPWQPQLSPNHKLELIKNQSTETGAETPSNWVHFLQMQFPSINISKSVLLATEREFFYQLKLSKVKPVLLQLGICLCYSKFNLYINKYECAQSRSGSYVN